MDWLNDHSTITQNAKCIANGVFAAHFKYIKCHSFPFVPVYYLNITRI